MITKSTLSKIDTDNAYKAMCQKTNDNYILTPNAKYNVANNVPKYAEVNGSLGTENKCFR